MRICILTHTMPRFKKDTNSASFISELAESLVKNGNEVVVLTPFDPLFEDYKRPFKVVAYKYIWPTFLHTSGYSRVLQGDKKMKPSMYIISSLMSLSALINLILLSRKYKFDVVSAHWVIPNGFIAYLASFVTRIPYTVTIPGSDVFLAGKNLFFKTTMRLAVMKARFVISDSKYYLSQLSDLGIKPRQTAIIRYGVNTKILKPRNKSTKILSSINIAKSDKVILCLGRFVEKKGFRYAIEAMPKIIKKLPKAILLLVGDGELKGTFINQINKLKIKESVVMPGAVPYSQRADYYNLADVFVMPSIKDSKGNIDASPVAMMDAMACGIPVVATAYSAGPDVVIDGQTGYIVKEKNSDQIAESIIKILQNKSMGKIKTMVRNTAVSHFSLEKTADKYSSIFEKI